MQVIVRTETEVIVEEYKKLLSRLAARVAADDIAAALRKVREGKKYFSMESFPMLTTDERDLLKSLEHKVQTKLSKKERKALGEGLDKLFELFIRGLDIKTTFFDANTGFKKASDETLKQLELGEREVEKRARGREDALPMAVPPSPVSKPWDDQLQLSRPAAKPEFDTVEVFYGTDRKRLNDEQGNTKYGSERGDLEMGIFAASIPRGHTVGEIERPGWLFKENPKKHIVVLGIKPLDGDAFFSALHETVTDSDEKDAFVFIHGFNVEFDEAARRTAQMAHDLSFKGAPIMYSWPSTGKIEGYIADEENVRWSIPHLEMFLTEVISRSGAKKLHLIAHSMGTQALVEVLRSLKEKWVVDGLKLPAVNQVILAAPDIDAEIFKTQIAPAIVGYSQRITLYASSEDEALGVSRKIRKNQAPRAGEGGERILVIPGIDSIDASSIRTDQLGHGYFASTLPLLTDLYYLMTQGFPPEKRNLREQVKNRIKYWVLPKSG